MCGCVWASDGRASSEVETACLTQTLNGQAVSLLSCAIVFLVAALGAAIICCSGVASAGIVWVLASIASLVALGVGLGLSVGRGSGRDSSLRELDPTNRQDPVPDPPPPRM